MSKVYLGGIPVAATTNVAWAMTSGVEPYTSVFTVHESQWKHIEGFLGNPATLRIEGLNGKVEIERLYPLHEVPTSSPHRRAVLVADRRWLWPYRLFVRDYNVVRKTGNRVLLKEGKEIPVELAQARDTFQYLPYSLDGGNRWTAKRALEDVLEFLERDNWSVRDLPINDPQDQEGQTSIQNLILRDPGNIALARVASSIPGLGIWVDYKGKVEAFNAADLRAAETRRDDLGPIAQAGGYPRKIERWAIRPGKVRVYFVRELEVRFDYREVSDYTTPRADKRDPFIENVIPLPNPTTDEVAVRQIDGSSVKTTAVQGTFVEQSETLRVWERDRKEGGGGALPWAFDPAIKYGWLTGAMMNLLAPNPAVDTLTDGVAEAQVQALQAHWRQTFRINPRYMAKIRDLTASRVALLDPITGTRSPAMVWSQYAIVPTLKAVRRIAEAGLDTGNVYNVDAYPGIDAELSTGPSPHATIQMLDPKLGVFRLNYSPGPYGLQGAFVPSLIVDGSSGGYASVRRALRHQDDHPIAAGCRVDGVGGVALSSRYQLGVILTVTLNSPNDYRQLHVEDVDLDDVLAKFSKPYGLGEGGGPDLDIFVPPSIATARFGWSKTSEARSTIRSLMDDGSGADADGNLPGYAFINHDDEVKGNALAAAVEALVGYADAMAGSPMTKPQDLDLVGGVQSIVHGVEPGGRVSTSHIFRGRQTPIDRFALLPTTVRHITLGIIPYGGPLK